MTHLVNQERLILKMLSLLNLHQHFMFLNADLIIYFHHKQIQISVRYYFQNASYCKKDVTFFCLKISHILISGTVKKNPMNF